MTFWQAFKASHRGSFAFLLACPLLALVPVVVELLQHAVEVQIGMYDSVAMAKATENHPWRLGFGFVKVLALIVPGYWVARFLAWRDPALAGRLDPPALALFGWVIAFNAAATALQLFVLPRTGWSLLIGFLVMQTLGALLVAWVAAAAVGNAAIGPRESARIMAPRFVWTFLFCVLGLMPLMVPHYLLGAAAIMGPRPLLWPVLILDSLLVGWLAALIVANGWVAALRATQLAGVVLIPPAPVGAGAPDRLHRPA